MILTSHQKLNLGYIILTFQRKLSKNNQDTAEFDKWPLIEPLDRDDVIKIKIKGTIVKQNCFSYNILKFGRKLSKDKRDTLKWIWKVWRNR